MSTSQSDIPSSEMIENLMKDPVKKALLLQFITQEKSGFESYKRRLEQQNKKTPLKKVQRRVNCESPTALMRRRMLEQRDQGSTSDSSDLSETTEIKGPKLPFDELLKGVRAFVDVKRDGVDKSEGIKAVMKLMGATIRDEFTGDVTHVIFKDGSFTTFEKARLIKAHLVSVLWLDAVRRNSVRVPEKNYPAFGSRVNGANMSIMCSQLQKDYEEIIRDEKRRTLSSLPQRESSIEPKRRCTMIPQTQTSMSSYATARNRQLSESDNEVASILEPSKSPELTSDDSDCGVIDGCISKRPKDQTDVLQSTSFLSESTDSVSLLSRITTRKQRSNVSSDMDITPNTDEEPKRTSSRKPRKTSFTPRQDASSTDEEPKRTSSSKRASLQSSTMSSSGTKSGLGDSKRTSSGTDKTKSGLGDSTKENTKGTTMSSLRLSDSQSKESVENRRVLRNLEEMSNANKNKSGPSSSSSYKGTTMSSLRLSDSQSKESVENGRVLRSLEERSNANKNISEPSSSSRVKKKFIVESSDSEFEKKRGNPRKDSSLDSGAESDVESFRSSRRSVSVVLFKEPEITPVRTRTSSVCSETRSTGGRTRRSRSVSVTKSSTPVKKTRKLYDPENPNISAYLSPQDDKEREDYIREKSQKTQDLFVNPNNLSIRIPPKPVRNVHTPRKQQRKKSETPPDDEQRALLDLLNASERRRSQRLSVCPNRPKYFNSDSDSTSSLSSLPITPIKRRSTLDFVPISQSQKRQLKLDPKRKSSIVCTKFHSNEVVEFESIVNSLGRFFVEDVVTSRTTHLVVGEAKRTINMLRAIARGCWILNRDWLLKSHQQGKWLNEEDYELTEYSPSVQECRLQREAFGPSYSMDIFKDCGFIYLGKSTKPKTSELKELITICKGKITTILRNASIVVGEYIEGDHLTCVTEVWVLDSIHLNKLKSVKNYLFKSPDGNSPIF